MTSQRHFRFRTDTGAADATPTWGADEDSNTFTPGASPFRLRLSIENPTHTAIGSLPYQIYLSKNGGAYSAITTSSTNGMKSADAGSDADNTSIFIPRLTVPAWTALAGAAIDLDFANEHIYPSGAFSDYLSVSRASIGYAKTSAGGLTQFSSNVLRITDGLLVEDARTNVAIYSEDCASWNSVNVTVTSDQATAPNNTSTMDQLSDGTASGRHIIYQSFASADIQPLSDKNYASAFLKDVDRQYAALFFYSGNVDVTEFYAFVDLQNGTITDSGVVNPAIGTVFDGASIEAYSNGIYRVSVGGVFSGSATESGALIVALSDRSTYTGDMSFLHPSYIGSNKSIYAWGGQVEHAPNTSSYIPTTTTSAVRAADVITCIGALQTDIAVATGSLVAQINNGKATSVAANIVDSNGTNLLGFDASNHGLASIMATLATSNTANRTSLDKLGIAWNASGRSLVLNGGTVATDATAQTPSSTQHIGSSGAANFAFAYIKRLTVWTSKLADATLQGHTT